MELKDLVLGKTNHAKLKSANEILLLATETQVPFKGLKKKLYGPFLWVYYKCRKAIEPLRGDSLLFTSQNSNVNCSAILGTLSVLHEL